MKTLLATLTLALPLCAAEPTAERLLQQAVAQPGGFNQMCALPPPPRADGPMRLFGLEVPRMFPLSETVVKPLRARRAEVVPVLAQHLAEMDLHKPPAKVAEATEKGGEWPPSSGLDSHWLCGPLLQLTLDLEAVEALPGLLKVEAQLQTILEAAESDPAVPVPNLPVDGIVYPRELSMRKQGAADAKKIERQQAILRCKVYQREVVSVMAGLLRKAEFEPFLKASIPKSKTPPPDEPRLIAPDGWKPKPPPQVWGDTDIGETAYLQPRLAFTPELRKQVRDFAQQFVTQRLPK